MPAPLRLSSLFGATVVEGAVRFRLWAPAAREVSVALEDESAPHVLAMEHAGDGWFELTTDAAGAGTLYRFRLADGTLVPDPASRCQPHDVHGPSMVVDGDAYLWRHDAWRGRPWHEAVLYEVHVGAYTREGTFAALTKELRRLADLGVTAVELMPLAEFSGKRNWGYDGVLPFAPDAAYGSPDDLKRLVDEAHGFGIMMFLDVVYNHFGPDGNYLPRYAPQFFSEELRTPWGAAIDFTRAEVREFVIANALHWIDEFRFDGLRLDAVHAIVDPGEPHILDELAVAVRERVPGRVVHLVLENDHNAAHLIARDARGHVRRYDAQWNDDIHHAMHVLATNEVDAYYADYATAPIDHLARCLAEGFAYQGEPSPHRNGAPRGEPSAHLPPTAFVAFLQNHDQIGNRAFGERLSVLAPMERLRAMTAILLLAPQIPLLFMGQEWGATQPFLYFCDYHDDLAARVREGRRREFERFDAFRNSQLRERIPDPNSPVTFARTQLDAARSGVPRNETLAQHRELLAIRRREIVPRLANTRGHSGAVVRFGDTGLGVTWRLGDGSRLALCANLGDAPSVEAPRLGAERVLYATNAETRDALRRGRVLPPWSVAWLIA